MERMRDLLRSSLSRSLEALPPFERLAAAWPVVCGPQLARRGELLRLDDGVLTVRVVDPVWLEQFRAMGAPFGHQLGRIAGVPVRAIHFEGSGTVRETRR